MATLPISTFLTTRLTEFDPKFELRSGTGFEALFFEPMEFIVQPLRDEFNTIFTGQSLLRILLTDNPDTFDESYVDALVGNFYVTRRQGGFSGGVARVYYNDPVDREYPAGGAIFTGSNGLTYSNTAPYAITAVEMSAQIDTNGLYFMDLPIQSDTAGADTVLPIAGIVSLASDTDYVSVTNLLELEGGLDRETNLEVITRTQSSIGVRDLVAGGGFSAILFDNFSSTLAEVQPIGFGDPEMMRDIVYNVHIGGKVDGYAKTPALKTNTKDFVGLLLDDTRQAFASTNVQLFATVPKTLNNPNVDRSNSLIPIVKEIKPAKAALVVSTVSFSTPANLATNQYVKIGIDGTFKTLRLAGINPASTTRNEIINLINAGFGIAVAFVSGSSFMVRSPTTGISSSVVISNPDSGTSAIMETFGLSAIGSPYTYLGDGPVTYTEGQHYTINDAAGTIQRILGTTVVSMQVTGQSNANSEQFLDATSNVFLNVQARDVLTIASGPSVGDYRVLEVLDPNTLVLDKKLTVTAAGIQYSIARTGIKSGEVVYVQYYYNPLSIDIGNLVKLDSFGTNRGLRPGRANQTITDLPLVRITLIEIIDAITLEPTGQLLVGASGYGHGGYGEGGYGSGGAADWYLIVNSPTERFSMFEDSYIVLNSGLQGLSFRVHYEYAPEISQYHDFVRSDAQRVLDGDILMKHFLPAYVNGKIQYYVDKTDSSVPSNDVLQLLVKNFINKIKSGKALTYSEIIQFIVRTTDPFDRYGTDVLPFTLNGVVHNTNGTATEITGTAQLQVDSPNPFPRATDHPLSARITHWFADDLTLERLG